MKAIRLTAAGQPLELVDVPVPEPGADEVLIRVAGCGVCHTDIGFWKDGVPTKHALPLTLGHEISGTVVAARPAHRRPAPSRGHRARGDPLRRRARSAPPAAATPAAASSCPATTWTAASPSTCASRRGACAWSTDRAGHDLAALSVVADAVTTPYQAIVRSGLEAGDLAVVVGVGGVGAHCVQIAAALGARVVALDIDHGAARHGRRARRGAHRRPRRPPTSRPCDAR